MSRYFNQEAFDKWEDEQQIPQNIVDMVDAIAEKVGCPIEWITIRMRSRGGFVYAYGKGIRFEHCTFSYADGPSPDYSEEMSMWLKGLGFRIENSYGDNGMDYSTNWRDTYWTYEMLYTPSLVYSEEFEEYHQDDDDDDYEDCYNEYNDSGWAY